jgi:hypothetical protein
MTAVRVREDRVVIGMSVLAITASVNGHLQCLGVRGEFIDNQTRTQGQERQRPVGVRWGLRASRGACVGPLVERGRRPWREDLRKEHGPRTGRPLNSPPARASALAFEEQVNAARRAARLRLEFAEPACARRDRAARQEPREDLKASGRGLVPHRLEEDTEALCTLGALRVAHTPVRISIGARRAYRCPLNTSGTSRRSYPDKGTIRPRRYLLASPTEC